MHRPTLSHPHNACYGTQIHPQIHLKRSESKTHQEATDSTGDAQITRRQKCRDLMTTSSHGHMSSIRHLNGRRQLALASTVRRRPPDRQGFTEIQADCARTIFADQVRGNGTRSIFFPARNQLSRNDRHAVEDDVTPPVGPRDVPRPQVDVVVDRGAAIPAGSASCLRQRRRHHRLPLDEPWHTQLSPEQGPPC